MTVPQLVLLFLGVSLVLVAGDWLVTRFGCDCRRVRMRRPVRDHRTFDELSDAERAEVRRWTRN